LAVLHKRAAINNVKRCERIRSRRRNLTRVTWKPPCVLHSRQR